MKILKLSILFLVLFSMACVENESCREKTDIRLRAGFVNFNTNANLTVDSISIWAMDNDSLLYNNRKSVQSIILPLKKLEDMTVFICRFNELTDTISLYHTNRDYFLSFACGTVITHQIDTILTTNHFIREIKITERNVNMFQVQNIQILH